MTQEEKLILQGEIATRQLALTKTGECIRNLRVKRKSLIRAIAWREKYLRDNQE